MFAAKAVSGLAAEAIMGEEVDVVASLPILGQVSQDFADYAAKLKAMTRTSRGVAHLRMIGMEVDQEVAVGRIGEHAGFERHQRTGQQHEHERAADIVR